MSVTMKWLVFFLVIIKSCTTQNSRSHEKGVSNQQLENWTSEFGRMLYELSCSVTKYKELHNRFQHSNDGIVEKFDLNQMIDEILDEVNTFNSEKITAVKQLSAFAQQKAYEYLDKKSSDGYVETPEETDKKKKYYNAKMVQQMNDSLPNYVKLVDNAHFGEMVNLNLSTVHVPTSIYDQDENILEAIFWSKDLDVAFTSNYKSYPTLSWQYFGSSTGFLRQFPGVKWKNTNEDEHDPDLYDCRFRPWYVQAANYPKNIVILHDVSGSMTGLRREIAKHVVSTILDTLTENDFVAVFNFTDETVPLVPCFENRLVQANLKNVREFKVALEQDRTAKVANFTTALLKAFEVLAKHRENDAVESAKCNQAIMLITDGAPYHFEEIFRDKQDPANYVRMFTYLIGREVTDKREVMWMACAHKGYFVHVTTLGEVQEQVLKYMPVMSRPMVMYKLHNISWTPVYADISLYRTGETGAPLVMVPAPGKFYDELSDDWSEIELVPLQKFYSDEANRVKWPKPPAFNFMVSVSYPVFDLRNATTRELKVKVNDSLTLGTIEQKRIANFLGVVGTDIPIKELIRMTSPFKLGVNGYAFAVTNNGHVIFHPDWRPVLPDDILKPNYNSIDVMEIELMDNDTCFRNNDTGLYEMRKDMVDQVAGHRNLRIRVHQDNFKRVTIRNQKYEYRKLDNTSYSLAISVPQNMYRFKGVIDVTRVIRDGKLDVVKLFDVQKDTNPRKWKLHPDWSYCWYIKTPEGKERTKDKSAQENLLMYFIKKIQTTTHKNWMWKNLMKSQEEIYHCDRDLVQSLVFDANITEVFSEEKLWRFNKDDPLHSQFIKMYGVHLAFIATRTGLTRWIGPLDKDRPLSLSDVNFEDNNIRAIDELWYKRAVERWYVDPESFVYSIPFDAGTRTDNLVTVTATRAIFIENKGHHAPVAVTGIQFDHAEWRKKFFETTSKCMAGSSNCQNRTCDSGTLDCYVLDDNGYVLISEKVTDHGKFFGDIDGMVMEMMVKSEIYKQVRVVDYQATCLHPVSRSSFADFLKTPFHALKWLLNIALSYVAWLALELNVHSLVAPDFTSVLAEYAGDEGHIIEDQLPFLDLASINKTRLRPCDQEYKLYTYGSTYNAHNMTQKGKLTSCGHNSDCSGFFNVHIIPHTNLILVVTDGTCRCPNTVNNHSVKPEEVKYDVVESVGNLSKVNEIVDQICRTPNYPPLYRNRMYNETQCRHYHAEEESMKADCGLGTTMKPNYIITLAPLALIFILLKVVFAF